MIRRFLQRRRQASQSQDTVLVTDRQGNTRTFRAKMPSDADAMAMAPPEVIEKAERLMRESDELMARFYGTTRNNEETSR